MRKYYLWIGLKGSGAAVVVRVVRSIVLRLLVWYIVHGRIVTNEILYGWLCWGWEKNGLQVLAVQIFGPSSVFFLFLLKTNSHFRNGNCFKQNWCGLKIIDGEKRFWWEKERKIGPQERCLWLRRVDTVEFFWTRTLVLDLLEKEC